MSVLRNSVISFVLLLVPLVSSAENPMKDKKTISLAEVADAVIERGEKFIAMENYQGLLYLQSMAEFAMATKSDDLMRDVRAIVKDFVAIANSAIL